MSSSSAARQRLTAVACAALLLPSYLAYRNWDVIFSFFFVNKKKRLSPSRSSKSSNFYKIVDDTDSSVSLVGLEVEREQSWNKLGFERPCVLAMVGLPARGKSFLSKMIVRYLKWQGFEVQIFNVGAQRRAAGKAGADAGFFDVNNIDAKQMREQLAMEVQETMYNWLKGQNSKRRVAIFDATNTTKARRQALSDKARAEEVFLLFVESICDDKAVLKRNYELKLKNEDYVGMDKEQALSDFAARVRAYEAVYETTEDDEDKHRISYVKLINVGEKLVTRNCTGYLPSQVVYYLQNVHIQPRKIYLALISSGNASGEVFGEGGPLSSEGRQFALDIAKFTQLQANYGDGAAAAAEGGELTKRLIVLTGTSATHSEGVQHLRMHYSCFSTSLLNELRAGDMQGLNMDAVSKRFPLEMAAREEDKLNYRYPGVGGESYRDLFERVKPILIELERQRNNCLIVASLSVCRAVTGYFTNKTIEEIPRLTFGTTHALVQLSPGPFGCTIEELDLRAILTDS